MQKKTARYFLMAERDKRGEISGTEPAAQRVQPAAAQGGTGGTGQGWASGTSGGKSSGKWRQLTNTLLLRRIRHQAALAAASALKRTDRLQHHAERTINYANNPFFGPHARGTFMPIWVYHIQAVEIPCCLALSMWQRGMLAKGHAGTSRKLWANNGKNGYQVQDDTAILL